MSDGVNGYPHWASKEYSFVIQMVNIVEGEWMSDDAKRYHPDYLWAEQRIKDEDYVIPSGISLKEGRKLVENSQHGCALESPVPTPTLAVPLAPVTAADCSSANSSSDFNQRV